jgi:hypothetical protein
MSEADEPPEARDERVRRRLELLEREGELLELLRRTRFTVPVWIAAVVFFLWMGGVTGKWAPAAAMTVFAALAGAVNQALRRRRARELAEVRERMEALPPAGDV